MIVMAPQRSQAHRSGAMRYRITHRMGPPTRLARRWYRRMRMEPPEMESRDPLFIELARLVPYRHREFHHAFAVAHGFFWLPCPWCGQEFGGHEPGDSLSDPVEPSHAILICSRCTIKRNRGR